MIAVLIKDLKSCREIVIQTKICTNNVISTFEQIYVSVRIVPAAIKLIIRNVEVNSTCPVGWGSLRSGFQRPASRIKIYPVIATYPLCYREDLRESIVIFRFESCYVVVKKTAHFIHHLQIIENCRVCVIFTQNH